MLRNILKKALTKKACIWKGFKNDSARFIAARRAGQIKVTFEAVDEG